MSGLKDAFLGDTPYSEYVPPYVHGSATSKEAAQSIAPHVKSLKARVLSFFIANPQGATDEQLIDAIGLSASTIRPRRIDLVNDGILCNSGRYAITKSGRKANLWTLTERAVA